MCAQCRSFLVWLLAKDCIHTVKSLTLNIFSSVGSVKGLDYLFLCLILGALYKNYVTYSENGCHRFQCYWENSQLLVNS